MTNKLKKMIEGYEVILSTKTLLIWLILLGPLSESLNILSIKLISVAVVSLPQKAIQSLTTMPAPTAPEPLLTVPATRGSCNSDESSSWSSIWKSVLSRHDQTKHSIIITNSCQDGLRKQSRKFSAHLFSLLRSIITIISRHYTSG